MNMMPLHSGNMSENPTKRPFELNENTCLMITLFIHKDIIFDIQSEQATPKYKCCNDLLITAKHAS